MIAEAITITNYFNDPAFWSFTQFAIENYRRKIKNASEYLIFAKLVSTNKTSPVAPK